LPDGMFSNQKPQFGYFLQWKMLVFLWPFGLSYGHFVYFLVIWYILWWFGVFFPIGNVTPRKIWHPWCRLSRSRITSNLFLDCLTILSDRIKKLQKSHAVRRILGSNQGVSSYCRYANYQFCRKSRIEITNQGKSIKNQGM
jgi:hypothetical protein